MHATENSHEETMKMLLDQGAGVDVQDNVRSSSSISKNKFIIMRFAVSRLIDVRLDYDLCLVQQEGLTALMLSCSVDTNITRILVEAGADYTLKTKVALWGVKVGHLRKTPSFSFSYTRCQN